MQAAVRRLPRAPARRQSEKLIKETQAFAADDTGLLDALPIAAAIMERRPDGELFVAGNNSRFSTVVQQSTCTALNWNDADCLRTGPISEMIHAFFDGASVGGDLDFKDGEGVGSRYFRMKLAPLPRAKDGDPRCLL